MSDQELHLLLYDVVDDYVERRVPLRTEHLGLAQAALDRGELVAAGALEPADGAVLVFRSSAAAEAFVDADPYVRSGIVTAWRVRKWNVVVGSVT